MNYTPLSDWIVVEKEEAQTPAGLVTLSRIGNEPETAIVLAVGPGRQSEYGAIIDPEVREGDRIILNGSPGVERKIEGRTVYFIRPGDVYAVYDA